MYYIVKGVALVGLAAGIVAAQEPPARPDSIVLTLAAAVMTAERNNPGYHKAEDTRRSADGDVRQSRAALYPTATANLNGRYLQSGQQLVGGLSFPLASDVAASSYGIGLSYTLNASTLFAPRAATARRDAVEASISSADGNLRAAVTESYLQVLEAQATAAVEDTLVRVARQQVGLVTARLAVGADVQLDAKRAEVAYGEAQVGALTAHANASAAMARLYEQLGLPDTVNARLTTQFAVYAPTYSLTDVLREAQRRNPDLLALAARERASEADIRVQRGRYGPTLTLQTEWGGQAFAYRDPSFLVAQTRGALTAQRSNCFLTDSIRALVGLTSTAGACNALPEFTGALEQSIRHRNGLPLRFVRTPWALSAQISLPLLDNGSRAHDLDVAKVQLDDARFDRRARRLKLASEVTRAYLRVVTSARSAGIEKRNLTNARDEIVAVEDCYRVGTATFVDVAEARGSYERAWLAWVTSTYDNQRALAELNRLIGSPVVVGGE